MGLPRPWGHGGKFRGLGSTWRSAGLARESAAVTVMVAVMGSMWWWLQDTGAEVSVTPTPGDLVMVSPPAASYLVRWQAFPGSPVSATLVTATLAQQ